MQKYFTMLKNIRWLSKGSVKTSWKHFRLSEWARCLFPTKKDREGAWELDRTVSGDVFRARAQCMDVNARIVRIFQQSVAEVWHGRGLDSDVGMWEVWHGENGDDATIPDLNYIWNDGSGWQKGDAGWSVSMAGLCGKTIAGMIAVVKISWIEYGKQARTCGGWSWIVHFLFLISFVFLSILIKGL